MSDNNFTCPYCGAVNPDVIEREYHCLTDTYSLKNLVGKSPQEIEWHTERIRRMDLDYCYSNIECGECYGVLEKDCTIDYFIEGIVNANQTT